MRNIDCFGILDDDAIRWFFELGCEVKGLGRGHVKRIKDQVKDEMQIVRGVPPVMERVILRGKEYVATVEA
jgi:hypothetical protein